MSPRESFALRDHLDPGQRGRTISDPRDEVSLSDILSRTCLGGRLRELSGRSVLLAPSRQLLSALAMIEPHADRPLAERRGGPDRSAVLLSYRPRLTPPASPGLSATACARHMVRENAK